MTSPDDAMGWLIANNGAVVSDPISFQDHDNANWRGIVLYHCHCQYTLPWCAVSCHWTHLRRGICGNLSLLPPLPHYAPLRRSICIFHWSACPQSKLQAYHFTSHFISHIEMFCSVGWQDGIWPAMPVRNANAWLERIALHAVSVPERQMAPH